MADEFDRAAELEQLQRDTALANAKAASRAHLPSLTSCKDCDADIKPQRQALGGVDRCAECEGYHQQELRQRGFAA